jgi:hypothetical protein
MFMKDNKKNAVSLIMAKMKKKPEDGEMYKDAPEQDGAVMSEMSEQDIAADELFEAIEKKDKKAFYEALKSCISLAQDSEGSVEEPEEMV